MTLAEFDEMCLAPDVEELDRRQAELLRILEFMVEMRRMWNGVPPKEP